MDMEQESEHKTIIIRLTKTLCDRFDDKVNVKGLSRSEVVRMLMDQYIESEEPK